MGWSVLVVGMADPVRGISLVQGVPRPDTSVRGAILAGTDGKSVILSALDGGARDRSAAEFGEFFSAGCRLLAPLSAP